MSTDDESEPLVKREFLMTRFSQLNEKHIHHNTLIHGTFYLSIVFFGIFVAGVSQVGSEGTRSGLLLFSAVVFASLGFWTKNYLQGRRGINRQMANLVRELNSRSQSFEELESIEEIFPEDELIKDWEDKPSEHYLLEAYYASLVVLSLGASIYFLGS